MRADQMVMSQAPEVPSGLCAHVYSATAGEIVWNRPTDPRLIYEVRRDRSFVATTNETSYYDDTLSTERRYVYEVIAIDPQGMRSSVSTVTLKT